LESETETESNLGIDLRDPNLGIESDKVARESIIPELDAILLKLDRTIDATKRITDS
jgi:hypothetical protein